MSTQIRFTGSTNTVNVLSSSSLNMYLERKEKQQHGFEVIFPAAWQIYLTSTCLSCTFCAKYYYSARPFPFWSWPKEGVKELDNLAMKDSKDVVRTETLKQNNRWGKSKKTESVTSLQVIFALLLCLQRTHWHKLHKLSHSHIVSSHQ